ncbi:MAG: helix-turn-helix domain-containing protein [Bulleidia sp.]
MKNADFSSLNKEIGERIMMERDFRRLSQKELAEQLHYSKAQIGKVERGDCMVTLEMAVALSKYFEISLDYLIFGKEERDSEGILRAVFDRLNDTFEEIIYFLACHLLGRRNPYRRPK